MPRDVLALDSPLGNGDDVLSIAPDAVNRANLEAADKELKLTPQEKSLYERHLSNLTGPGGVDNPDGSRSTLYQMTVGLGDKTYVLPTVWNGQILTPEQAIELAREQGLDTFPSYENDEAAETRYQKMHEFMERDMMNR